MKNPSSVVIIKSILTKYLPNKLIDCEITHEGLKIHIAEIGFVATITNDTKWIMLKKMVDSALNKTDVDECGICYNTYTSRVHCNQCYEVYCINCYINIFTKNQGLIVCPYCRFTYGSTMSQHNLIAGILEIKNNNYIMT